VTGGRTPSPVRPPLARGPGRGPSAPVRILFGTFLAFPILASLALSFTSFGLRDLRNPIGTSFIGFENYLEVFGDPKFWTALQNTTYFVVVGVPLTLVLGLGIANALNRGVTKFRTAFRVGYYLPVITSIVAMRVVCDSSSADAGLVNMALASIGIDGPRGSRPSWHARDHRLGRLAQPRLAWSCFSPGSRPSRRRCTRPPRSTGPPAGRASGT
jgi:multiple sugar transport system permease protein